MGSLLKTKGGFVIDRPGNVLFVPVTAAGALDYANAIRNTAVINTITVTNSKTKTEIPDGNNFYPAGDRVTAITGTVAIEFSTIDPAIWAMCSGTAIATKQNDKMMKMYEYQKIDETTGKINVSEKYAANGFVQIIGADGTTYEKVANSPSEGEFAITAGTTGTEITFADDDKGKTVVITMEAEATTISYSQGRTAMKYHKIIIDTEYSTLNDTEKLPVNVIISQASVSGDMVDSLQKDPSATKTLTFNMYAPLPGEQPYQVKFKDMEASERVISSIAITTPPTKTTYTAGETFDATGMVVTATYSDATTETVTDYTYSPTTALATTDTAVTITFSGKTATQAITVTGE